MIIVIVAKYYRVTNTLAPSTGMTRTAVIAASFWRLEILDASEWRELERSSYGAMVIENLFKLYLEISLAHGVALHRYLPICHIVLIPEDGLSFNKSIDIISQLYPSPIINSMRPHFLSDFPIELREASITRRDLIKCRIDLRFG